MDVIIGHCYSSLAFFIDRGHEWHERDGDGMRLLDVMRNYLYEVSHSTLVPEAIGSFSHLIFRKEHSSP
jgi:hypothetical protein